MRLSTRIIVSLAAALLVLPFVASADEAGPGGDVVVPAPRAAEPAPVPAPVAAAPPAWVELETTTIAAGIGFSWGGGTLAYEGRDYEFELKGMSLVDLGASTSISVGDVHNLENLADFEGSYVAVQAAGAAGSGASAITMRNENGVVISLHSELKGVQLALATHGLKINLKQ
jgi:hypothetical protein